MSRATPYRHGSLTMDLKKCIGLPHFKQKQVLHGCLKNDRLAQEQLYKHYFALMYHICKDFTNQRDTILSLINEGFLKIFTGLATFDAKMGEFEPWAKRIMRNHCIDYVRQRNKLEIIEDISILEENNHQKVDVPDFVEDEILFHLKKMPATTQQVFNLHIFKGFSHKEIGAMMNIAESTSRWHLLEARKELKNVAH